MRSRMELKGDWWIRPVRPEDTLNGLPKMSALTETPTRETNWYPSAETLSVHEILLNEGVLDPKILSGDCESAKWVAESDWMYATDFPRAEIPRNGSARLSLKGVDTVADVYLNGEHLAFHEDMFLPLCVDITKRMREKNHLVLYFHSPYKIIREREAAMPDEWRGHINPCHLLRKAPSSFGNFLGAQPYLCCMGLFDEVSVDVTEKAWIEDVDLQCSLAQWLESADVDITAETAGTDADTQVQVAVFAPDGGKLFEGTCKDGEGGKRLWLHIDRPALWWPKPFGEQPLYRVVTRLLSGGEVLDETVKLIGIRRVERAGDFLFKVNNKEIRLWGANIVNISGITNAWNKERGEAVLNLVNRGNMNILRTWGEAPPMGDEFYDFCDQNGIFIWQDLFTGYGFWPDSESYRELYRKEAEYWVKKLRHRPSLLMWCGNNELYMYALSVSGDHKTFGFNLIHDINAEVCRRLDPGRYYHASSPMGGRYPQDPAAGDIHGYCGINFEPGVNYPLFFSESCRATALPMRSMRRFMSEEEIFPSGYVDQHVYKADFSQIENEKGKEAMVSSNYWRTLPMPETWRKHMSVFATAEMWDIEKYYDAVDADSLLYKYSASAMEYFKNSIERVRRGRPSYDAAGPNRCRGYMIWKLNDAFPHINFTLIDAYLEPTATYYAVKRAFSPVLVSISREEDHLYLWGVNDSPEDISGKIRFTIFSRIKNTVETELELPVTLFAGEARMLLNLDRFGPIRRDCLLHAELVAQDGRSIASNIEALDLERNLAFPDARLELAAEGGEIVVKTDKYARCVELVGNEDGDEFGWVFGDNYFDLLPYETKRVKISGRHTKGVITAKAHYSTKSSGVVYRKEQ